MESAIVGDWSSTTCSRRCPGRPCAAKPIVQVCCKEHNIPYKQVSLPKSYAMIVRHLNTVGIADRDPFNCPIAAVYRA